MRPFILAALAFSLSGCIAKTALDIVSLPVKAASAGIDAATTSQAEADQRRGREIREEEERLGRLARRCDRNPEREECAELRERTDPSAISTFSVMPHATPSPRRGEGWGEGGRRQR